MSAKVGLFPRGTISPNLERQGKTQSELSYLHLKLPCHVSATKFALKLQNISNPESQSFLVPRGDSLSVPARYIF